MIYNGRRESTVDWPSSTQYPSYYPNRRLKSFWFLALAIVALTLSVAALIIVFSVEHSWFHDSYNQTSNTLNQPYTNQYGLWRLCFFYNQTCDSWFSSDGPYSYYVQQRLNQARVGINAWQALEIVFLFFTTSTLIITLASIICYRVRKNIHFYLVILAAFCVWPAACVGISSLFVFGFSVYNVSTELRGLDWCFWVNLVAVILSLIAAILITIYDLLLKPPFEMNREDTVIDTFADFNGHPATLSPSTFVVVKKNKNKKMKSNNYPHVLYPNHYFPTTTGNDTTMNGNYNTEYIKNPNHQMLSTSGRHNPSFQQQQQQAPTRYRNFDYNRPDLLTSPSVTSMPQSYQPPVSSYNYQPRPYPLQHWHRTEGNTTNQPMRYDSEYTTDYIQRGIYRPTRLNPTERTFDKHEEPSRVLHHYTGYDHFSAVDSSNVIVTGHHPPLSRPGSPVRYNVNPFYHQQDDYLKSPM